MSAAMEDQAESKLPAISERQGGPHSDVGDGSSSLSDIEQDAEQEGFESDDASEEDEHDSEAETERLDQSPNKQQAHNKDVVLSSRAESRTFERPSTDQQHQSRAERQNGDNDRGKGNYEQEDNSDDELSLPESPETDAGELAAESGQGAATSPAPVERPPPEQKDIMHAFDLTNKKRKRSPVGERDSPDASDSGEAPKKRKALAVSTDNIAPAHDDNITPNPVSGAPSDVESIDGREEDDTEQHEQKHSPQEETERHIDTSEDSRSNKRRRRSAANGAGVAKEASKEPSEARAEQKPASDDIEDTADVEADDAEAALKDEEEQEKKRVALEQLNDIEKHFSLFRDRLHEERLAKLNHEEWMIKQDPPIHPEYLAKVQCIDAQRDERLRVEDRRVDYRRETIEKTAVARRGQILSQFYQEVRDIREKKLELLGKNWYDIQHERRGYGSNVEDYVLKFPTKRPDQVKDQCAYNKELSVLSGIAKYRGFPAAPSMAPATASEMEDDFKRMGKSHQKQPQRQNPSLPLQDIAAARAAASTAALKPAEEQFIEQTPWANPQHPSHVHLSQYQAAAHQPTRTNSPFAVAAAPQHRRHSHQHASGLPVSGSFSGHNPIPQPPNNHLARGGNIKPPVAAFATQSIPRKMRRSPLLGNRQATISPQQHRPAGVIGEQSHNLNNHANTHAETAHSSSLVSPQRPQEATLDSAYEGSLGVKREQPAITNGRL